MSDSKASSSSAATTSAPRDELFFGHICELHYGDHGAIALEKNPFSLKKLRFKWSELQDKNARVNDRVQFRMTETNPNEYEARKVKLAGGRQRDKATPKSTRRTEKSVKRSKNRASDDNEQPAPPAEGGKVILSEEEYARIMRKLAELEQKVNATPSTPSQPASQQPHATAHEATTSSHPPPPQPKQRKERLPKEVLRAIRQAEKKEHAQQEKQSQQPLHVQPQIQQQQQHPAPESKPPKQKKKGEKKLKPQEQALQQAATPELNNVVARLLGRLCASPKTPLLVGKQIPERINDVKLVIHAANHAFKAGETEKAKKKKSKDEKLYKACQTHNVPIVLALKYRKLSDLLNIQEQQLQKQQHEGQEGQAEQTEVKKKKNKKLVTNIGIPKDCLDDDDSDLRQIMALLRLAKEEYKRRAEKEQMEQRQHQQQQQQQHTQQQSQLPQQGQHAIEPAIATVGATIPGPVQTPTTVASLDELKYRAKLVLEEYSTLQENAMNFLARPVDNSYAVMQQRILELVQANYAALKGDYAFMLEFHQKKASLLRVVGRKISTRSFDLIVPLLRKILFCPELSQASLQLFAQPQTYAIGQTTNNLRDIYLQIQGTFSRILHIVNVLPQTSNTTEEILKVFEKPRSRLESFNKQWNQILKKLSDAYAKRLQKTTSQQKPAIADQSPAATKPTDKVATVSAQPFQVQQQRPQTEEQRQAQPTTDAAITAAVAEAQPQGADSIVSCHLMKDTLTEEVSLLINRNLTEQAITIFNFLKPSEGAEGRKAALLQQIDELVKQTFGKGVTVHLYGSSASNFAFASSDMDLCIDLGQSQLSKNGEVKALRKLRKALFKTPNLKLKELITSSRVPIIKIYDKSKDLECDICINNKLGVINSRLLNAYSRIDDRVRPLVYFIKKWAKKRGINDASAGTLSSYSYVLLAIFYLQMLRPPILPSLQLLGKEDKAKCPEPHYQDGYDCQYFADLDSEKVKNFGHNNTLSLGEVIYGFFKFYAEFDWDKYTVSIRLAKPIPKQSKHKISIEDPFELRDLGQVTQYNKALDIIREFKLAYDILRSGGSLQDVEGEATAEKPRDRLGHHDEQAVFEDYIPRKEALMKIQEGKLYQGVLRVNKKHWFEAYVPCKAFTRDILIDGHVARNRALHGDLVAVEIIHQDNEKNELSGKVVCILEKRSPSVLPCVLKEGKTRGTNFMFPLDKRFPKILIFRESMKGTFKSDHPLLHNLLFMVRIDAWKKQFENPLGSVISTLGLKNDLWVQKQAIVLQNMLNLSLRPIVPLCELDLRRQALSSHAQNSNVLDHIPHGVVDLRRERIFTIDPLTAKDLDDALSIDKISDTEFRIGVHIADVSRFVKEGSDIDREARARGTSVYIIDSVEHMLDPSLSQNLCSLLPDMERHTMSVIWNMTSDGLVKEETVKFCQAVITSCVKLDYDTAQYVIDHQPIPSGDPIVTNGFTFEQVKGDILMMHDLAQTLRRKRERGGSLFLSGKELRFNTDTEGNPIEICASQHTTSHELVEEFMLLANQLAAKKIFKCFGDNAILRRHLPPSTFWHNALARVRGAVGLLPQTKEETQADLAKSIPAMLDELRAKTDNDPLIQSAAQYYISREMTSAEYIRAGDGDETERAHFALNVPLYTHFTSPIRRYADLIVHRLIAHTLEMERRNGGRDNNNNNNAQYPSPLKLTQTQYSELCTHLNEQAVRARNTEEQCQKVYLARYLRSQPALTKLLRVPAVVLSMGRRAFTIFVPEYWLEIMVNIKNLSFVPDLIDFRTSNEFAGDTVDEEDEEEVDEVGEMDEEEEEEEEDEGEEEDEEEDIVGESEAKHHTVEDIEVTEEVKTAAAASAAGVGAEEQHDLNGDGSSSAAISSLTMMWNIGSDSSPARVLKLYFLKKIMVDLCVDDAGTLPEVSVLNVWEYDEDMAAEAAQAAEQQLQAIQKQQQKDMERELKKLSSDTATSAAGSASGSAAEAKRPNRRSRRSGAANKVADKVVE